MRKLVISAFVGLISIGGSASADVRYSFTDLGTGGGAYSIAYGINDLGSVVGWFGTFPQTPHSTRAFSWSAGVMQTLDIGAYGTSSKAYAINDSGSIVGYVGYEVPGPWSSYNRSVPTRWDSGVASALPGGLNGIAQGINNAGVVVGSVAQGYGYGSFAVAWEGQNSQFLGNINHWNPGVISGPSAAATAVNESGKIVGASQWSEWHSDPSYAAAWSNPSSNTTIFLPDVGGGSSQANAINNAGDIVGNGSMGSIPFYNPETNQEEYFIADYAWYLDASGNRIELKALGKVNSSFDYPTYAYDINDLGQIVGSAGGPATSPGGAVLWENGEIVNLNSVVDPSVISDGWRLWAAYGINNKGQIVGIAYNEAMKEQHAFLLTPVPEPEMLGLFLAGLSLIGLRGRRKACSSGRGSGV